MADSIREYKEYLDMAIQLQALHANTGSHAFFHVILSKVSPSSRRTMASKYDTREFKFQLVRDWRFNNNLIPIIQQKISLSTAQTSLSIHRPGNVRALHHIIANFCRRTIQSFNGHGVRYTVEVFFYDDLIDTDDESDGDSSVFGTEGGEDLYFDASESVIERVERFRGRAGIGEETCSICLGEFDEVQELVRTPCFHVFHYPCIVQWFEGSGACPICRFLI